MTYYLFDKCPEDKVDNIAKLCTGRGMDETKYTSGQIQWIGRDIFASVTYDPKLNKKLPLKAEPWGKYTIEDQGVKDFLNQLMEITGTEQIYIDNKVNKLDMNILK